MLLSKKVEIKITNRNKKIYLEKGYLNSIYGNIINVNIIDLPESSGQRLEVKCDYCDKPYIIRYCDYIRTKHEFLDKDACKNCWHKKRMDITNYRVENKLINNPSTRGYWSIEENIEKELFEFIKTNNSIGQQGDQENDNKWFMISWAIKNKNLDLDAIITKLGFDVEEVRQRRANGIFIPFQEIEEKIHSFVKEYGFFPGQNNLSNDLKINNTDYQRYGTLQEIRDKLGYNDKKYLVDNRGFINRSSYEIIVANYLIAQNIPYKREQHPFREFDKNEKRYRSDFTFYLPDREIQLEVWGGMSNSTKYRNRYHDYDDKMEEKMRLYDKYNIELISITPDIFYNSMKTIKKKLYKILSPYLDLPFIEVKDRLVSTFTLHEMSDEKLLEEIMKYSKINKMLPSHTDLRENGQEFLYKEVLKRFDSLRDFAETYGMTTAYKARSKKVMKSLLSNTP